MAPCQKQLMLQNLFQNRFFTPNANMMSNPNQCQNQMILPKNQCNVCQNNPPIPRSAVNPFYANRVLANPTLRSILDPNTKFYNQHGVEVPRSFYELPNVVNNYIIVPPEVFMENCKKVKNGKSNKKKTEKSKNRTGRRKNRKNRKDIDAHNNNEVLINELAVFNENTTETLVEVTNIPEDHKTQDVFLSAAALDKYIDNQTTDYETSIKNTINEDKVTELNESQTTGSEIEEFKNELLENQPQITNINTQTPVSHVNSNPYTQEPMSNLYSSPYLPNNYQYVNTGVDKNANNNMFNEYLKCYGTIQNDNVKVGEPLDNNAQVNARIIDKHVNTTDIHKNTVTKSNRKPKRKNNSNKPKTMKSNGNLKPQDREEFVVQDFKRKFPNIPESLVRDLICHMKKHLQQEQNTVTNQYPMFPWNFEQLYGTPFFNTPKSSENGKKKSNKRKNRRRKAKSKNKQDANRVSVTDTTTEKYSTNANATIFVASEKYQNASDIIEANKIKKLQGEETISEYEPVVKVENIFVTEKVNTNVESPLEVKGNMYKENTDSKLSTKLDDDTEFKLQSDAVKPETAESITTPELGKEDIVLPMHMNGVDDYYPDFRDDNNAYFLRSMEEASMTSLEDRYHYTTDRNQFENLNRERRKFEQNNIGNNFIKGPIADRNIFEYITTERGKCRPKSKAIITENTTPKIEQTTKTEVQFITPPSLEKPDFETIKITRKPDFDDIVYKPEFTKRNTINNDIIYIYSNEKTPQYNLKEKPSKNVSEKLPDQRNIETVFANSRVVKYGQNFEDNSSDSEGVKETTVPRNSEEERDEYLDIKIKMVDDGDRTIVFAKSADNVY